METISFIFCAISFGALGFVLGKLNKETVVLNESSAPRVVVNLPADAKILPQMDGDKVIAGERAILWYSVYCKATDDGSVAFAADDADQAVETVFGS